MRDISELLPPITADHGRDPGALNRREAYHIRRAGFGVWTCTHDDVTRRALISLKREGWSPEGPELFAADLARLIRAWSPVLPAGWSITCPPQGASSPGPYFAADLAAEVADLLGLPFVETLERTDAKPRHGLALSLAQKPFATIGTVPAVVLIIDDLISTGRTMALSLAALRGVGTAAFGFALNCS